MQSVLMSKSLMNRYSNVYIIKLPKQILSFQI